MAYAAQVVAERRWHPSQEIKRPQEDGGVIELRLRVAGLEDLTRWVLSWGGRAKVLAPEELAQRVAREAGEIMSRSAD